MTSEPDPAIVTLAKDTIHNPAEGRHFMKLKPIPRRVRAFLGDRLLADSRSALRVLEVGYDVYDPIFYFPKEATTAMLVVSDAKQTNCPLKGEATYFNLGDDDQRLLATKIAWSYMSTFDFARELAGMIAFDPSLVSFIEEP